MTTRGLARPAVAAAVLCAALAGCGTPGHAPAAVVDVGVLGGKAAAHAQRRILISVHDGRADHGEQTVNVALGAVVEVTLETDLPDEFHLHGYNIERELRPGELVTFVFRAVIPGQFDGEFHGSHITALRLEVR